MFINPISEAMITWPMTSTPQMTTMEVQVLKSFQLPASMTSDEVARLIRHCLHLFGPSSIGLACTAPDGPNRYPHLKTLLANVAARLLDAEYEVHEIDESEHAAASTVIGQIDQTLQQTPLRQWSEMAKRPTPSENQLLRLHLDLFQEPTYPLVAARWQTVVVAEMRLGTMQAKSSLSAFLTPLRHFTRNFPPDQLPATFANLSPAERHYHAQQVRDFFANPTKFSLVHRTRLDYAQTVIHALGLGEPSARKGRWIWGTRHRIADLDIDPPESAAQDDGYHREAYLAAARATAQSMGERPDTLEAAAEIEASFDDQLVVPIIQLTGNEEASQADMVRAYYFSADRNLMEGYRSPFDQRSPSLHMICALDRWAGEQPSSLISIELRLLLHLLLHTGRDLDWLLSVNFGRLPDSSLPVEVPVYVPEANAIFCSPKVKLTLPELSSSHPAHNAYQPIMQGRSFPLSPFAQKLIQRSLGLRHNPNAMSSTAPLFVTMNRKRMTRMDVNTLLFQPFAESMQMRQPELPNLTVGKLRRAFWTLYIYHGLASEDAQFISDQCYLDLRAPLFYACRQAQTLWSAYQTAHLAVCQSLSQVFRELHPGRVPATFDSAPKWSAELPSKDVYYGACYCPRPEVLQQLVQTMIASIHHEWKGADIRQRFDLLTYACAFGVSLGLGLRIGEAANLTWAAFDPTAGTIAIEGKSDRFAEEFRVLPGSELLMKPLKLLEVWHKKLKLADTPESPFFQVFHGKPAATPITREYLWRQLRRWADVSGLEDSAFRWHALRHAVASHLLEVNALTFAERSYFLGHTAGQQWLDELRVGEQRLVFERFRTLIDQRLNQLGFNLNDLSLD